MIYRMYLITWHNMIIVYDNKVILNNYLNDRFNRKLYEYSCATEQANNVKWVHYLQ